MIFVVKKKGKKLKNNFREEEREKERERERGRKRENTKKSHHSSECLVAEKSFPSN